MKRTSVQPIGQILSTYFEEVGIGEKIKEQKLIDSLESVLGAFMCKYITRKYINGNVLYLQVSNSILKGELSLNKASLINKLNEAAGSNIIADIIVK